MTACPHWFAVESSFAARSSEVPLWPAALGYETYQPWLRGVRWTGILVSNSSYYDWGMQVENVWLDK